MLKLNYIPFDWRRDSNLLETIKGTTFPTLEDIPYDKESPLIYKNIKNIEGMEWLKGCKFKTLSYGADDLDDLFKRLRKRATIIDERISDKELPILAIDTETNTLNTNSYREGGEVVHHIELVSIPIAISDKEGYLIPIKHNESDGVKNYPLEIVIPFLQKLVDNFFLIYFNYNYDGKILMYHGIEMKKDQYLDVMILGDALGLDTVDDLHNLGLKNLSYYFLDRKMLEINELVGSKKVIDMRRVSAKMSSVYACSDAVNTYALFEYFINDPRSPYKTNQEDIMDLDHFALYHHISMFNHGFPLNDIDEVLEKNLTTLIHRLEILRRKWEEIPNTENYLISNPEAVNHYIGKTVIEDVMLEELSFELLGVKKSVPYLKAISNDFGIILKIDENKSRGKFIKAETRKVGFGKNTKGVPVLDFTKKAIHSPYWSKRLTKEVIDRLERVVSIVDKYRVIQLEIGRIGKMYRYGCKDDRGYPIGFGYLRFNGTDTRRWKNQSGDGDFRYIFGGKNLDRVSIEENVNGGMGINSQGLPSTLYMKYIPNKEDRDPIKVNIKKGRVKIWFKRSMKKNREILNTLLITKLNLKK